MLPAIADLQTKLRSLFRTYFRDGDPQSGLNEPDIAAIRAVLGTDLPAILARQITGAAGSEYPEIPANAALRGKFFYLNSSGTAWGVTDAAAVTRAAELVDFEGAINTEIAAAVADVIADITEDAPFNERFANEAALLANLNFPAGAFAIDMETLVIYRKTGASGTGSWVVHSNILDAFPGTASQGDVTALAARVTTLETQTALLRRRARRQDSFHPPSAPFLYPLPNKAIPAGFSGLVLDLQTYGVHANGVEDNLTFTVTGLPAGFNVAFADTTPPGTSPQIFATSAPQSGPTTVTVTVADESDPPLTATRTFTLTVYDPASPVAASPVFTFMPTLNVPRGNPIPARDHALDVIDADSSASQIDVAATFNSASGMTVVDGMRGGRAATIGSYSVALVATDQTGNTGAGAYTLNVVAAPAPEFVTLPYGGSRTITFNSAPETVYLQSCFTDANTPYSEFATPLSPYGAPPVLTGAPPGTILDGLTLTLPTTTIGYFRPRIVFTNRAGLQITIEFDYVVVTPYSGGGGGDGGGGGREPPGDRIVF